MTPLLFCVVLTAAFLAPPAGTASQGATIPDDVTQLTLFIYADGNGNGWRDPEETPFLPPFDTATTRVFRLISATCDNDVVGWFVLAAEATNTVQTRRHCEYDLIGRPFGSDEALPVYIGTIVTAGMEMTLYIPDDGIPDNLLGTPTPSAQADTPTPLPSATASPPAVSSPTPTGTPTASVSPQPTPNPNEARTRVLLPHVPADARAE
ncbi:MAG: hypothetical protein R2851_02220 [Caldilineaceae bacterium]